MKRRYHIHFFTLFILPFAFSIGAWEHLVISKPEGALQRQSYFAEQILKEAYSGIETEIEFKMLPIERSLEMSNNGDTDGEFLRVSGIDKDFPNLIMIPVPIYRVDVVVYAKRVEFDVKGWQSLSPYTIGIVRGFKIFENNTKGMRIEKVNTVDQAFLKLDAGRTDVVVEIRNVQCRLNELNVSGIKIIEPPIDQLLLYHYLHKRHKNLAVKLEKVLRRMEKEGQIKCIQEESLQDLRDCCQ
jgi:polar amino acid transport system substrate-binding protein